VIKNASIASVAILLAGLAACLDPTPEQEAMPDAGSIAAMPDADPEAACQTPLVTVVVWVSEFDQQDQELGCDGSLQLQQGGTTLQPFHCNPTLPAPKDRYGQTTFRWQQLGWATSRVNLIGETAQAPPQHIIVPNRTLQLGPCAYESWHWIASQRL
jgi:hypothetical protein